MFDIFEQPWTLLIAAIIVLFATLIVRRILPEKQHWWQLTLPIFLAVAALGFDFFIQTDLEKINTIIRTAIKAAEDEDSNAISKILSPRYHDSYHNTKADLMHYCRTLLERPLVEKNRKMDSVIELSPPKATVTLIVLTKFDKESYVYKSSKRFLLTKVKLDLQKERNKRWLINRAELLELDRQQVKWQHIR